MPETPENLARIRVQVVGAEESKSGIQKVVDVLRALGSDAKAAAEGPFKQMWESFREGQRSSGSLEGAFRALTTAMQGPLGPMAAGITLLGAYGVAARAAADRTVEMYKELRQLQSVSGGTLEEVQALQNALTLMGVPSESLRIAMFRLGSAIETDARSLRRLGVDTHDAGGAMRDPIKVFEELRDKLSGIANEATRAAVAKEVFGRSAVRLMPIFKANSEEFGRWLERGKEMAAIDDALAEKTLDLMRSEGELELQHKKFNALFAETTGIPMKKWFDEVMSGVYGLLNSMLEFDKALYARRKFGKEAGGGILTWLAGLDPTGEVQAAVDAMKTAEDLDKRAKALTKPEARMTPEELKRGEEKLKFERDMGKIRIKAAADEEAEEAKLRTGFESAALERKIRLNAELVADENSNYSARLAILRTFYKDQAEEKFAQDKEVVKLGQEHQKRLLELEVEGQKERRKLGELRVKEEEKVLERLLAAGKQAADRQLEIIKLEKAEELNFAEAMNMRGLAKIQWVQRETETEIRKTLAVRLETIEKEIAVYAQLAEKYRGVNEVAYRDAIDKAEKAAGERIKAEVDANLKIMQERKKMIDELRKLEAEKAAIGGTLEQKAEASLAKQGYTGITQDMIKAEATRLMAWAETAARASDMGAALSPEWRAYVREYQGTAKKLTEMGDYSWSGISRDVDLAQQERGAAFGFRRPVEENVYAGVDVGRVDQGSRFIGQKLDDLIRAVREKSTISIDGHEFGNIVQESLTRLTEFQAARQL